ncbi:amino acid adenylation domain-containing protein [Staphylococcus caprae]|uniref:aureusimine non-ribosomal peptide synthetase AusA n=1 Tax=Staphylococcus caprae TaxID=29380 RepID=UPI001F56B49D|nr:non-ribosomal peptide synthetase [Staphylococcus caprae]MCI2954787.1 amino acid adenylation domain-containing protein [Staphylococcus caprae]
MTIDTLHFQQYFYNKYLQTSSTTKRVTYWVQLDNDIERHRLMYALLDVVQHQPMLRSTFQMDNEQLRIDVREFFPFIQIKDINQKAKNLDIEAYFRQELNSYYFNQLPLFNFTIYQFLDDTFLLLDFHSMIFNDSQLGDFFRQLNIAYNYGLFHEHMVSDFYNMIKDMNEDIAHVEENTQLEHFKVLSADSEYESYMPIKNNTEHKEVEHLHAQVESFDMNRLVISTYLANYFMSQSNHVALGIQFPLNYDKTDDMMLINTHVAPLSLNIEGSHSVETIMNEWESVISQMMQNGTSFMADPKSSDIEFETLVHASTIIKRFELNHTTHKVHRLYSDTSLLADLEIYPCAQDGFDLVYNANAYDNLTIKTLMRLIKDIYMQLTQNPSMLIKDIQLCNEEDQHLYQEINRHSSSANNYQTVIERFEYQVAQHPDKIALKFEQHAMTYAELNHRVNHLAYYLRREYEIQANDIVGLLAERSLDMIVGMLGILKSGAGYLPIDPDYPDDRTAYIIEDAQPKAVVTYQTTLHSDIPQIQLEQIDWYSDNHLENPSHINTAEDTAYIIYTSGTTGKPKGTVVPHKGIDRLVHQPNYVELNHETVILLSGTVAFDAATFEIYGALLNGGRLIITSKDTLLNPTQLGQTIAVNQINTMWLTSSLFNQIASERIEVLEPLTYLLIGGEVLNAKWVNLLNSRQRHPEIINGYGPTENTTFTTTYAIPEEMPARIPIGQPINGTTVYVMQGDHLCGVGIPGELCIGGVGLAKGYLNQPELTAERFVTSPFENERLYHSGDLVRLQEDGHIDYISRIDKQVKIRGFRIELSEIEKAIEAIRDINKAVVIVREHEQDKQIVAYYEASQPQSTSHLKEVLSETLPDYMIPIHFKKIDQIPITINGKLDKRALPDIEMVDLSNYVAPRNDGERVICRIFEEILHVDQVGIKDNFFELGGHSLRATLVVNRIEAQLKKRLKVGDIMKLPTVEQLSQHIMEMKNEDFEIIPKAQSAYQYELSAVQKSMYLLWSVNPEDTVYNIPFLWRLTSELNVAQLKRALNQLIARHEILRTQYVIDDNEVKQRIANDVEADFKEVTTRYTDEQQIIRAYTEPFNLEQPSQMRVRYIHAPHEDYLFIDTHHSINDGMSNTILLADLNALYQEKELPELALQYKDYSEWMANRDLSKQRRYWLQQFEDDVPVLNMPTDYPRPSIKTTNGNMMTFHFDEALKTQLQSYVEQHQMTDFMFFASAIMVLLHKYSRQDDIVIGSVISARTHRDTENMLGMFANTLVYRGHPTDDKTWEQLMSEIKETSLGAYEHQEYPFESLVNDLIDERDASRNPLFDVMLVLQNNETNHANFGHSQLTHIPPQSTTAKFDLSFIIEEDQDDYVVNIEYNTDLYADDTIRHMAEQLENIISHVISTQELKIQDIEENQHMLEWVETHVNRHSLDFPENKSLQQQFNDIVNRKGDDVALKLSGHSMTYRELDTYANRIANALIQRGVKASERVALLTERSFEMIACMVASWKVGASYVPIDVTNPEKRIEHILEDAEVSAILTYGVTYDSNVLTIPIESIDTETPIEKSFSEYAGSLEDEMYSIYTSGTTGMPKGVSVRQRNILNLVNAWTDRLALSEEETFMQYHNYVFDASAMEIYCTLLNGYKLVIANDNERTDTEQLEQLIAKEHITAASIPLQVCNVMKDFYISKLFTGGATSTPAFVRHISQHCDTYFNAYGPSESTVIATNWSYSKGEPIPSMIPIGQPLANIQVYILSGTKLCGVGISGELCIAGKSLTAGYLNRPELTAESFIDNPFGEGKLYRSGDLARYTHEGQIEFMGRIDKQVKVNGYRIELGEIENVINSVEDISDSVVIVDKQNDHEILHAYFVGSDQKESEVARQLNHYLPKYMIPKTLTAIDEIPLTRNDKVDESKLPRPRIQRNIFVQPRNNMEQTFVSIFAEVLEVPMIGIDDDFFEIGGTSLDAMVAVSKLKSQDIHITMQDVYQYKTVRHLAEQFERDNELVAVNVPDHLPQLQALVERRYRKDITAPTQNALGHVLLTGATGFLGAYLINELQSYADKVTCIVRGHDMAEARYKLQENLTCYFDASHVTDLMKNVDIVLGDLTNLGSLGINETIDTVMHAGARTDHFGDDEAFINVNVQGTEDLLNIAQQHHAKFIYISTISVGAVFEAHVEDRTFSEKDVYKQQLFTSPYTKSKFFSEIKVLEAVNDGLDAQIMRLGNLTSAYSGPLNMKNLTTNRFSIMMHELLKTSSIGENFGKTCLDFSFIDVTARHIVKLAASQAQPIIYHIYSPHTKTMQSVLEGANHTQMNIISDKAFEQMLINEGMHEVIGLSSGNASQVPSEINSDMTQHVIAQLGDGWPVVTSEWLRAWRDLLFDKFKKTENNE